MRISANNSRCEDSSNRQDKVKSAKNFTCKLTKTGHRKMATFRPPFWKIKGSPFRQEHADNSAKVLQCCCGWCWSCCGEFSEPTSGLKLSCLLYTSSPTGRPNPTWSSIQYDDYILSCTQKTHGISEVNERNALASTHTTSPWKCSEGI